ncbi:hypothetical protein [Caedibacter taeniospiralis]|nr:hypothetical protein [Caedibacter taeniospiralis]
MSSGTQARNVSQNVLAVSLKAYEIKTMSSGNVGKHSFVHGCFFLAIANG